MYKPRPLDMAEMILLSAKCHEESFDRDAMEQAAQSQQQESEEAGSIYKGWIDYNSFYTITLEDACKRQCGEKAWLPVYLLLKHSWNDALDWANSVKQ